MVRVAGKNRNHATLPASWPATTLLPFGLKFASFLDRLTAFANDPVADAILHDYRSCRILKSPSDWRFLFMVRKNFACP